MSAAGDFETVAWVYDPSDLALLLSLFESEGIWVWPLGRQHAAIDWPLTTALGGVSLRVHVEDAFDARMILASLPAIPFRAPLTISSALLMLLLFLLFQAPPPRQIPCFALNGATAAQREPYEG
jgi:hypothetical protein